MLIMLPHHVPKTNWFFCFFFFLFSSSYFQHVQQQNGTNRSASNPVQTSVIQSTKSYQNGSQTNNNNGVNNNANNINNNVGPLISEPSNTINDNPDINNIE